MYGPDPSDKEPLKGFPQVGFLKNFIKNSNIIVGDYTYYDDPDGPENFEKNVLYHFEFIGDKLIIGKFCAIARNVKFIMNGANHPKGGISTYPFYIFGKGWEKAQPDPNNSTIKGDTVVGNDVWIGYAATIMPGIHIGHGSIIASRSVVSRDVPPYSVVGGNPARLIRTRYDRNTIDKLLETAWWNWPVKKITENLDYITKGEVEQLVAATFR